MPSHRPSTGPSGPSGPASAATAPDPEATALAAAAGLRYTVDRESGYERRRCGRGFTYRNWRGRTVRGRRLRRRFEALAIPPAWTDVWICRHATGHLQATGRDEAGRKQYLYHPRWREARDREKFDRLVRFARSLPAIRRRVGSDLEREGLAREKVLAAIVRLLEASLARVGCAEYARRNGSYGLTTIRKRHVDLDNADGVVTLDFEGKGGAPWHVEIADPEVAAVVEECLETPGYTLFKALDADGVKRVVGAVDVNEYLRDIAGVEVTAKDFRTWAATVLAVRHGCAADAATAEEPTRTAAAVVGRVAERLGNTAAVCRQSYIHPAVLAALETGELGERLAVTRRPSRLSRRDREQLDDDEAAVLAFLERVEEDLVGVE
jgi:DNA topoisomerase-1